MAAGILIGAGVLAKYTVVLICGVLLAYLVVDRPFRRLGLHVGIVALVSVAMLAVWLICADHIDMLARQRDTIAFYAGIVRTPNSGLSLELMTSWRMQRRL
jgi:4-amino-4-deoxy-L-arabinose transferase-like glycosyltransferase